MDIIRDFNKVILPSKLYEEIRALSWSDKIVGVMAWPKGDNSFSILLNSEPTPSEDQELMDTVNNHVPSSSFLDEKELTDTRNKEGFDLYKRIFAHISDNEPVTQIDAFINISDQLHKLRNFLKDGNFETAVRYYYVSIQPLALTLFPNGTPVYREWIREIAIKYNPILTYNCELINPDFAGTPFEGVPFIEYIEQAPEGQV